MCYFVNMKAFTGELGLFAFPVRDWRGAVDLVMPFSCACMGDQR